MCSLHRLEEQKNGIIKTSHTSRTPLGFHSLAGVREHTIHTHTNAQATANSQHIICIGDMVFLMSPKNSKK